jgi:hypothetical protein
MQVSQRLRLRQRSLEDNRSGRHLHQMFVHLIEPMPCPLAHDIAYRDMARRAA